jgi:hypothetical protein
MISFFLLIFKLYITFSVRTADVRSKRLSLDKSAYFVMCSAFRVYRIPSKSGDLEDDNLLYYDVMGHLYHSKAAAVANFML